MHVRQAGAIGLGDQELDLSALAQLVEVSQTRAVAEALLLLRQARPPRRIHRCNKSDIAYSANRSCQTWKVEERVANPLGFSTGAAAALHPHKPRPGRLCVPRRAAPASSHEPAQPG